MTDIPDFTEAEQNLAAAFLLERYGQPVQLQLADSELQLGADPAQLTLCPTLYWNERGAHFAVFKVAAGRYRSLFFYSETEQYGTGQDEYEGLGTCVQTLLQVQADHERQLANVSSSATVAKLDDDYSGPLVI